MTLSDRVKSICFVIQPWGIYVSVSNDSATNIREILDGKRVQGFLSPATLYVCMYVIRPCWLLDASLEARHKMDQEMNGPGRSFQKHVRYNED